MVIRPDSGNPADILCGTRSNKNAVHTREVKTRAANPDYFGVIELLWDTFGGTVNEQGYKVLDSHIGTIYGDSITLERAKDIIDRLERFGFASTNVVFGIGSFTYQYVTRDTFASAIKATWAEVDGVGHDIMKDPVTDNGTKRSARGRLAVVRDQEGRLTLIEQATRSRRRPVNSRSSGRTGTLCARSRSRTCVPCFARRWETCDEGGAFEPRNRGAVRRWVGLIFDFQRPLAGGTAGGLS